MTLNSYKIHLKTFSVIFSVQTIIQLLSMVAGIVSVRVLSKEDNAYFTISNNFQTALLIASDLGLTIGLSSSAGKYWADQNKVKKIFSTGNIIRNKLAWLSILITVPLFSYQFLKIHTGYIAIILFNLLIIIDFWYKIKTYYYNTYYKLEGNIKRVQSIDLLTTIIRVTIVILASFFFLNNYLILISILIASGYSFYLHKKHFAFNLLSTEWYDKEINHNLTDVVKTQVPYFLYFVFQGQITLFLLVYFGNVNQMADYGALTRITVLFNIINTFFTIYVGPRFSKELNYHKSLSIYINSIGSVILFSLLILLSVYFFPTPYLFVLGSKYQNLEHELFLLFIAALINNLNGIIINLNNNKGWMRKSWLIIPFTIVAQVIFLYFKHISSLDDIILFGIVSVIPTTFIYGYMALQGFRQMNEQQTNYSI